MAELSGDLEQGLQYLDEYVDTIYCVACGLDNGTLDLKEEAGVALRRISNDMKDQIKNLRDNCL